MERTIRVTGKERIKVSPDLIRIIITLQDRHGDYEEAVRKSAENKELLNKVLAKQGFNSLSSDFTYCRKSLKVRGLLAL